jgi:nucleoid-associated protein YgaU
VLFVIDPIERTNAFYTYTGSGATLEESKGYFIYYDKNESMHGYMEANEIPEPEKGEDEPRVARERLAAADSVIRVRQATRSYQKDVREQRRVLNLLVGLSAVLFIVSFIMGAGLVQNQDRIASLENQVIALSTSYKNASSPSGQTAAAFAPETSAGEIANEPFSETEPPIDAVAEETASSTEAPATPTPAPTSYTVKDGDTLNSICVKFYGTTDMIKRLMEFNNITDPNLIVSGKTIQLPAE